MRDTFVFYNSFYTSSLHLPKKERGEFLECVIEYSLTGKIKEMPEGIVRAMFESCKVNIDKQLTNYKNGAKPKQPKSKTEAKPKRKPNYKEKEKEKEKEKDTYIIPNGININAFESWCTHKGKKYSKRAKTLACKLLANYDEATQLKMVETSIMNSWSGLFEPKQQKEYKDFNAPPKGSLAYEYAEMQKRGDEINAEIIPIS